MTIFLVNKRFNGFYDIHLGAPPSDERDAR